MFLSEFIGCFFIVLALVVTQAGGLAGGGALIPILLGFYRFDAQNAIAISNVSMGIGSAIRVFAASAKSHPLRKDKGVQIDYNITSVIMPACIIGVNLGIIANLMTPEPFVLGCLVLALIYLSISTGLKWWRVRKREWQQVKDAVIKDDVTSSIGNSSSSSSSEEESEIKLPSIHHGDDATHYGKNETLRGVDATHWWWSSNTYNEPVTAQSIMAATATM